MIEDESCIYTAAYHLGERSAAARPGSFHRSMNLLGDVRKRRVPTQLRTFDSPVSAPAGCIHLNRAFQFHRTEPDPSACRNDRQQRCRRPRVRHVHSVRDANPGKCERNESDRQRNQSPSAPAVAGHSGMEDKRIAEIRHAGRLSPPSEPCLTCQETRPLLRRARRTAVARRPDPGVPIQAVLHFLKNSPTPSSSDSN